MPGFTSSSRTWFVAEPNCLMKSSEVIEECDRFLRDFAHEAKDLGFSRTVYSADAGAVPPSSNLPSELLPVLKLFDGQRNLGQVLDDSPFRVFDSLKIIKRFVAAEIIRANTVVPPPGREAAPNLSGPGSLQLLAATPSTGSGSRAGDRGRDRNRRGDHRWQAPCRGNPPNLDGWDCGHGRGRGSAGGRERAAAIVALHSGLGRTIVFRKAGHPWPAPEDHHAEGPPH